jgi:integrase
MAEGIEVRIGKDGSKSYRANVWSNRDRKRIRKTFTSAAEAKAWRADALVALDKGALRAPKPTTVQEAWEAWYEGAKAGTVHNRSGDPYKPSAIRSYEQSMRLRVLDVFGGVRLTDLRRPDLQDFIDGMVSDGLNASTIQVTLLPLRAIFRRAVARGELAVNPCTGLELPAVRGRRERYASPEEAEALIAALPVADRPVWATAMYAGLRRGELRALRVEDVDLAAGVIHVKRGWDAIEGEIELKSNAGRRRVPIPAVLRDFLLDHLARTDRKGSERIFTLGVDGLVKRADKAWREAKLDRITLHECRHTFASLMIAAGVNAKALSTFMGHANISITLDRYGHLMPGSEGEAAELLDGYLRAQRERAEELARSAPRDNDGTMTPHYSDPRRPEATTQTA